MTLDDVQARCFIDDEGCWVWRGATSDGLPRVYAPNHRKPGSPKESQVGRRAVWHITTAKPIPDGKRVYGTCQNPLCLNPAHMKCGTTKEVGEFTAKVGRFKNSPRRIAANRLIGRKRSYLNPDQIAEIQSSNETGVALAERLNVGRQTVSKARRGELKAFESIGSPFAILRTQERRAA